MKINNIDWNTQAKIFLKQHNWSIENNIGFHPSFPLGEDFSTKNSIEKFCKSFYSEAWKNYKAYIKGMVLIKQDEKEKSDKE